MKLNINKKQKGFTLIELLVVIAIIAILAVVVILTLNPAELLRQARDSSRVSDFATLKSSIGLYEADVSSTFLGTSSVLYANSGATLPTSTYVGTSTAANWGYAAADVVTISTSTSRSVSGTGWLPINFSAISSGAPIGSLPQDPVNGVSGSNLYVYTYVASGTVYKLAAKTESVKYSYNGSNDIESTDGGISTSTYEQGTLLSL
jgi:prepilin-type N-terminal cleavage/methylation domain-containing protein